MRALVVSHGEAGPVRFADVDEPVPSTGEALVEIRHIGLNFGELNYVSQWPADAVHGHDAAGVVVRAAADGSGPPEGTRVAVGMASHAWAERVAVSPASLGTVPEGVDLADAAALGIAGVTALRVLRKRSLLARDVLITGASGGVGHFAVQLAALAGARVTALVGSPERAAGLRELGADEVLTDLASLAAAADLTGPAGAGGRFDLVLDTVGGPLVAQAWSRLAEGGTIHLVGISSGQETTFPPGALFGFGEPRSVATYGDMTPTSGELTDLLGLMAAGRLSAPIGLRGDWQDVDDAVRALFARKVHGKAVLDVV
ncbi:zinc-binding dehydrogenase [Streptomyces sp. NPDC102365]|uniref:zinc-binding dehydrogenase n=1 Tax=Streptomyces sp. NPDC102365 TaxID=3366162 RepID=UPI0037F8DB04